VRAISAYTSSAEKYYIKQKNKVREQGREGFASSWGSCWKEDLKLAPEQELQGILLEKQPLFFNLFAEPSIQPPWKTFHSLQLTTTIKFTFKLMQCAVQCILASITHDCTTTSSSAQREKLLDNLRILLQRSSSKFLSLFVV